MITIKVKRISGNANVPKHYTDGSSGLDLFYSGSEELNIEPNKIYKVPTGIVVEIPPGYEGQVRPRSSLASKGIILLNSPGTIDADYRGEVKILMYNLTEDLVTILPGDRIAQLVISKFEKVDVQEANELSSTNRGTGGFGSTGR